jgi:hypothetical protein
MAENPSHPLSGWWLIHPRTQPSVSNVEKISLLFWASFLTVEQGDRRRKDSNGRQVENYADQEHDRAAGKTP